ncbi:MAG: PQQ-like beta-propeller repeat protein [Gemmatimonadaceae bacterium]|jgi:outer membrane protein assembly factor BamB|nr:PQQ-like beta-propeller repeat protein [Gemmatimonadaceae bacterium]
MPKRRSELLHIGIHSHVLAIDPRDGTEVWRTKLKASAYVTLHRAGDVLYAGAAGELFCLDAATGAIRWHNKLKGLGTGLVSFGGAAAEASSSAAHAAQVAALAATVAATA